MGIISKIIEFKLNFLTSRSNIGAAGRNTVIGIPTFITSPKDLYMEENSVLRLGARIQNNPGERVYIGKYTVVGMNVTIVTNNHCSTVGIPQCLLGVSHINDKSRDIHIGEDVWVGTNVTILSGGDLGRGCIVGACSTVTKPVPPYALVIGSPARIVGVKFNIDQILKHEIALYPESERMSREELEVLFAKHYEGMRVFGVQTEISDDDKKALEIAKKQRGYIDPTI